MNDNQRSRIIKSAEDAFRLKREFLDFQINFKTQLLVSQLDLFKELASVIIAILSIGFLFDKVSIDTFSVAAFVLSIFLLLFIFSFIRETIDRNDNSLVEVEKMISRETDAAINAAISAIKKDNPCIYNDYIREKSDKLSLPMRRDLSYVGELVVFLFSAILMFAIASFLNDKLHFSLVRKLFIYAFVLIISWAISFKEWSIRLNACFSKKIS